MKRLITVLAILVSALVFSGSAEASLSWFPGTGVVQAQRLDGHLQSDWKETTTYTRSHVEPGEPFSMTIATQGVITDLDPPDGCRPQLIEDANFPQTVWTLSPVTPGGPTPYEQLVPGTFQVPVTGVDHRQQWVQCDPVRLFQYDTLTLTVPDGLPSSGCYQTAGINASVFWGLWSGSVATLSVGNADCGTTVQCDFRIHFSDFDASIPGVHLFAFDTLVRYEVCPDGTVTFLSGDGTQLTDFGWTTLGLEVLGFELTEGEIVVGGDTDPSPSIINAGISGNFGVLFHWDTQLGQIVGGKIGEELGAQLVKKLEKAPRSRWTSILLTTVDQKISQMIERADEIDEFLIDHGVPAAFAEALEDAIEEPLQAALHAWRFAVQRLNVDDSTSAQQLADKVVDLFLNIVTKPIPLELWTPDVHHHITSADAFGTDFGFHNPFLSITRTRDEVVS
jgi:hypothetical protein